MVTSGVWPRTNENKNMLKIKASPETMGEKSLGGETLRGAFVGSIIRAVVVGILTNA